MRSRSARMRWESNSRTKSNTASQTSIRHRFVMQRPRYDQPPWPDNSGEFRPPARLSLPNWHHRNELNLERKKCRAIWLPSRREKGRIQASRARNPFRCLKSSRQNNLRPLCGGRFTGVGPWVGSRYFGKQTPVAASPWVERYDCVSADRLSRRLRKRPNSLPWGSVVGEEARPRRACQSSRAVPRIKEVILCVAVVLPASR